MNNKQCLCQPEFNLLQDSYWESVKNGSPTLGLTNIRREHFDDYINATILNCDQNQIISSETLKERIKASKADFYVYAHLSNELFKYSDIIQYIYWAKEIGFKEVHFITSTKSKNYLYGIFIYFGLDFDNGFVEFKNIFKKDESIKVYFDN